VTAQISVGRHGTGLWRHRPQQATVLYDVSRRRPGRKPTFDRKQIRPTPRSVAVAACNNQWNCCIFIEFVESRSNKLALFSNSLLFGTTQKISIGYSASGTQLPELLLVTLSHETHVHLVFLNISIGFLLSNA